MWYCGEVDVEYTCTCTATADCQSLLFRHLCWQRASIEIINVPGIVSEFRYLFYPQWICSDCHWLLGCCEWRANAVQPQSHQNHQRILVMFLQSRSPRQPQITSIDSTAKLIRHRQQHRHYRHHPHRTPSKSTRAIWLANSGAWNYFQCPPVSWAYAHSRYWSKRVPSWPAPPVLSLCAVSAVSFASSRPFCCTSSSKNMWSKWSIILQRTSTQQQPYRCSCVSKRWAIYVNNNISQSKDKTDQVALISIDKHKISIFIRIGIIISVLSYHCHNLIDTYFPFICRPLSKWVIFSYPKYRVCSRPSKWAKGVYHSSLMRRISTILIIMHDSWATTNRSTLNSNRIMTMQK